MATPPETSPPETSLPGPGAPAYQHLKSKLSAQCTKYLAFHPDGLFGCFPGLYKDNKWGEKIPSDIVSDYFRGGIISSMAIFEAFIVDLLNDACETNHERCKTECRTCEKHDLLKEVCEEGLEKCKSNCRDKKSDEKCKKHTLLKERCQENHKKCKTPNCKGQQGTCRACKKRHDLLDNICKKNREWCEQCSASKCEICVKRDLLREVLEENRDRCERCCAQKSEKKDTCKQHVDLSASLIKLQKKRKNEKAQTLPYVLFHSWESDYTEVLLDLLPEEKKSGDTFTDYLFHSFSDCKVSRTPINYNYVIETGVYSKLKIGIKRKGVSFENKLLQRRNQRLRSQPNEYEDESAICAMLRLFYGIRCIMAHGKSEQTLDGGALKDFPQCSKCPDNLTQTILDDSMDLVHYLITYIDKLSGTHGRPQRNIEPSIINELISGTHSKPQRNIETSIINELTRQFDKKLNFEDWKKASEKIQSRASAADQLIRRIPTKEKFEKLKKEYDEGLKEEEWKDAFKIIETHFSTTKTSDKLTERSSKLTEMSDELAEMSDELAETSDNLAAQTSGKLTKTSGKLAEMSDKLTAAMNGEPTEMRSKLAEMSGELVDSEMSDQLMAETSNELTRMSHKLAEMSKKAKVETSHELVEMSDKLAKMKGELAKMSDKITELNDKPASFAYFHICRVLMWLKKDRKDMYITYRLLVRINQFIDMLAFRIHIAVAEILIRKHKLPNGTWGVEIETKNKDGSIKPGNIDDMIERFEKRHKEIVKETNEESKSSTRKEINKNVAQACLGNRNKELNLCLTREVVKNHHKEVETFNAGICIKKMDVIIPLKRSTSATSVSIECTHKTTETKRKRHNTH